MWCEVCSGKQHLGMAQTVMTHARGEELDIF